MGVIPISFFVRKDYKLFCTSRRKKTRMKIHFLGANRQVTGSRYCIETKTSRLMIDCGLFQEREYTGRNWNTSTIPPKSLTAMLLTHAHIDHTGLVPRMIKEGFNAPIMASQPTVDLANILLKDAAKIQREDANYKKRRHKKQGKKSRYPIEPLYEIDDVEKTLGMLQGVEYHKPTAVTDDITVTFHDAGHILGSAFLELKVQEDGEERTILLSGDIGQNGKPLIRDPDTLNHTDVLIMESTYGDRDHTKSEHDVETQLENIINETVKAGGKTIIPTFAVERAQEIMYHIARLVDGKRIPEIEVYLDSPMAVDVTKVFRNHRDCLDEETWELISSGTPPLKFPGLHMSRSVEESKRINEMNTPCVIMSTSGMCTAGRIKHHLKRCLPSERNTILFVGYQANGTLGRQILDGREKVRIHGKQRDVRASIRQIHGFSGHADRNGLIEWSGNFGKSPKQVFLTHGDEDAAEALAADLRATRNWNVTIPHYQSTHDLV